MDVATLLVVFVEKIVRLSKISWVSVYQMLRLCYACTTRQVIIQL